MRPAEEMKGTAFPSIPAREGLTVTVGSPAALVRLVVEYDRMLIY